MVQNLGRAKVLTRAKVLARAKFGTCESFSTCKNPRNFAHYRDLFGVSQRLARTPKSFRLVQVSHCGSSSRRMFCSNGFDTMHVACTDLLCVVCIGSLSAEFSSANIGLGRPIFWKPLCLLSGPEGLATMTYQPT